MRFGFHMPVAGGLAKAARASSDLGLGCLQIFAGNPRGWSPKPLDPGQAAEFAGLARQAGLAPVAVHAPYLINLASPDPDLWARSVNALADQLGRARSLGARAVVVHPGSRGGRDLAWGLQRVAEGVRIALAESAAGTACWLENTCGAGGQVGSTLEELAELMRLLGGQEVGVCLDTAHAWAAGYPLNGAAGVRRFLDRVESVLGAGGVALWHLNDTRHPLGSRRDEHQHLGQGLLGRAGVRALITEPRLREAAMIMETPAEPPEGRLGDLALARALCEKGTRKEPKPRPYLPERAGGRQRAAKLTGQGRKRFDT